MRLMRRQKHADDVTARRVHVVVVAYFKLFRIVDCSMFPRSGRHLRAASTASDMAILQEGLAAGWSVNSSGLNLYNGSTQLPGACLTFPTAGVKLACCQLDPLLSINMHSILQPRVMTGIGIMFFVDVWATVCQQLTCA